MPYHLSLILSALLLLSSSPRAQEPVSSPRDEVIAAERAFAKTMADRDHTAFATFVAEDAVFFGNGVLRGRAAVVEGWKGFFTAGTPAPFSWEPDTVEVAGNLAQSSGPVRDPAGTRVGTFNSTWRRDTDGRWRVLFDKGCPPCGCKP